MECGSKAAALAAYIPNDLHLKAAASQPHSMGFAVKNALFSILHLQVKS
jgi:hypothetical protein